MCEGVGGAAALSPTLLARWAGNDIFKDLLGLGGAIYRPGAGGVLVAGIGAGAGGGRHGFGLIFSGRIFVPVLLVLVLVLVFVFVLVLVLRRGVKVDTAEIAYGSV